MLYSESTNGFYLPGIHGSGIPADAVEISAERHAELIDAQGQGRVIVAGADGRPDLTDAPEAAPVVPQSVSRFQARAALHAAGLLQQVEDVVSASAPIVQIAWADAQEFRRDSPTIASLADAVGLDGDGIDDLFRAASQIVA